MASNGITECEADFIIIQSPNNQNNVIQQPSNQNNLIQPPINPNHDCGDSLTTVTSEDKDQDKKRADDKTACEIKDDIKDCDDSDQEQVNLIDVFDGSMDRQVEFGHITVSEDALCRDVDLFAKFFPNLSSKFLRYHWEYFTVGVREERERTVIHGVTDPRLFSNLLTTLSKPEDGKK